MLTIHISLIAPHVWASNLIIKDITVINPIDNSNIKTLKHQWVEISLGVIHGRWRGDGAGTGFLRWGFVRVLGGLTFGVEELIITESIDQFVSGFEFLDRKSVV